MPLNLTTSRPVARATVDSDIQLSATVSELADSGGFLVDITASGQGLTPPPFTITASLQKDSDAIAGIFPLVKVGDGISGAGVANGTKVLEVTADGLKLSAAATADKADTLLSVSPPAGVKICSVPIAINQATDPSLGTILELVAKLSSSQGEKVLGSAQITLDTELSFNRIERK
jgi:hypothetical protein